MPENHTTIENYFLVWGRKTIVIHKQVKDPVKRPGESGKLFNPFRAVWGVK